MRHTPGPRIQAVHLSGEHTMSKPTRSVITLIEGIGVDGDAHAGTTVKHRSRVRRDPTAPNLRQVHLIQAEVLDELRAAGFPVTPGLMGENVTTRGLDLLALPAGAQLKLGDQAAVLVTGLRNPCAQLDGLAPGLMRAMIDRNESGGIVRRAGIMAVVVAGGDIRAGDGIVVTLPDGPLSPLEPV